MPIVTLIVWLALLGLVTWAVLKFIPLSPGIGKVIQITAVVIAILIVLSAFGVLGHFPNLGNVPTVR